MEEQLSPFAVTHLLQHSLRSLCNHEDSQWVYAVFWRILPRNFPPPKWDVLGGVVDRSRGNRRNWILVWEDGFCNFFASAGNCAGSSAGYGDCNVSHHVTGLQPELFFKMSHEIYSYGEGLIGKVAADHSHKWVFNEPQDLGANFLPAWQNPADSHPRTWEAQFQSGIKTITLIAVREGVIQLGAATKMEDLSYVLLLRKKFSYLESIPGVLLPHPLSAAVPLKIDGSCDIAPENWAAASHTAAPAAPPPLPPIELLHLGQQGRFPPSTNSLEALLSKLPSVGLSSSSSPLPGYLDTAAAPMLFPPGQRQVEVMGWESTILAKEEIGDDQYAESGEGMEVAGSSISGYYVQRSRKTDRVVM
ncbi:hypothetical protein Taro_055198 [Colocasia esculenta]|uniref:Transcription factor MYC/MYB N-terminal domain-containing protein n=1 Tax=Colocasia esculenta TaxID=4460 RepID=A0A843XSW9_COLES|nr:hypothetical protein [Colocasia esculenta]